MSVLPVTVVIPAFGRPELLAEALASVAEQTCPPHETIVIDDGSPEPLEPVATRFGVRTIRRPNGGVSAARNTGLEAATQPWIAFLDSDDCWKPRKLARQFEALALDASADAVISDFRFFGPRGRLDRAVFEYNAGYAKTIRHRLAERVVALDQPQAGRALATANYIQLSTLIVRREVALAVGGFDESLRYCEDYEFALRLLARARALSVEESLVWYRSHDEGLSAREAEMRRGDLQLEALVRRSTELYPQGAATAFIAKRPSKLLELGKGELLRGDDRAARAAFRASLRERWTPLAAAAVGFSYLAPILPQRWKREAVGAWSLRPWNPGPRWRPGDPSPSS